MDIGDCYGYVSCVYSIVFVLHYIEHKTMSFFQLFKLIGEAD